MRRFLIATLVLGGCASKTDNPSPPSPLPLKVHLKPARYASASWNVVDWTLLRGLGRVPPPDSWLQSLQNGQRYFPTRNWFTLYENGRPRFLLEEKPQELRIMALTDPPSPSTEGTPAFREFAQIPLPLEPGRTWKSRREGPKGGTTGEGSCRPDRIEAQDGAHDALRVDFAESGETRISMWFNRTGGLLRWRGIALTDVDLAPGSPLPFQLGIVAASYSSLGRVDDVRRWAPAMCAGPPEPPLRTSASRDEATHGRKQYYLYALDRDAYLHAKDVDQPDGQVVVKESWVPGSLRTKGPLFLMLKSEGEWIYATATPDGKEITASGTLASCRECHESERTRDRMFGLTSCAAAR